MERGDGNTGVETNAEQKNETIKTEREKAE